eukprot:scaffold44281_cov21-Tisochrysis_lutea.AAC.1
MKILLAVMVYDCKEACRKRAASTPGMREFAASTAAGRCFMRAEEGIGLHTERFILFTPRMCMREKGLGNEYIVTFQMP